VSASAIEVADLERTFPGRPPVHALRGVTFTVQPGEFVALTGPSGSGKSTLLQILGCLDLPTAGDACVTGRSVRRCTPGELATLRCTVLGFVFQDFHLIDSKTAAENAELPLQYQRTSRRERYARAVAALTRVGLGHRLDHRPGQLSGGEKQRVAIARALVTTPSIILADEPTGNLDSTTEAQVVDLLRQIAHESTIAVVVATHSPRVAERADRTLRLVDGTLT
jgi:putative ABC transport system ATP-binding protein